MTTSPPLGVVIVTYGSAAIIGECLESLFASEGADLRVVVVDNHSPDRTCEAVIGWASGADAPPRPENSPLAVVPPVPKPIPTDDRPSDAPPDRPGPLTLLRSPINAGYAHAVNQGLKLLLRDRDIRLFWVLNPDCVVPADAATTIVRAGASEDFALMGGRTIYYERPEVQTDGGTVSRWTGVCTSVHRGLPPESTALPATDQLDYITGASLIASRRFIDEAGLMPEDYFLYYEEVDWAFRRGDLPLRLVPDLIVYHRGGTSIGTGDTTRRPSPFANYFNYRNRLRFVRRYMPARAPLARLHALAKALLLRLRGAPDEAGAILAGIFERPPPAAVRDRISDEAARALAFAPAPDRAATRSADE